MLSPDFREFVALLNVAEVKYLIVGGYAVGVHGHPRYTGDLDVWINPDKETAEKVVKVLIDFGFGSFGLSESDFLKSENVIQLGYPPFRIDILTNVDGVSFAECFKAKVIFDIEGLPVNFIDLENLRKNKASTGRKRDLDDLENLADQ